MNIIKNRWVLCIGEHQDIGSLISATLSRLGYVVLSAQSYDEAIAKVQNVKFALYVINCEMSDDHARGIYEQIRAVNLMAPTIFTSPANIPRDVSVIIDTGGNYVLGLPFELSDLEAKVSQLV
jgi:DNA-binding response OmpR family regulator